MMKNNMTCDNCEYKHTCNKHRVYDDYNDKVTFVEYTNETCDGFKAEDALEIDTIKDLRPGFVFKCRGLLYPFVKYEDGTVHRVSDGELVDLPETLPVANIVCSSFGDTTNNFYTTELVERCEQFYELIFEYYCYNKYYLTEPAKDALLNAHDCMLVVSGRRDHLAHNFSGCDSHLPYITQLAYDKYLTDQMKEVFHTAYEALIEVFVHRKQENR